MIQDLTALSNLNRYALSIALCLFAYSSSSQAILDNKLAASTNYLSYSHTHHDSNIRIRFNESQDNYTVLSNPPLETQSLKLISTLDTINQFLPLIGLEKETNIFEKSGLASFNHQQVNYTLTGGLIHKNASGINNQFLIGYNHQEEKYKPKSISLTGHFLLHNFYQGSHQFYGDIGLELFEKNMTGDANNLSFSAVSLFTLTPRFNLKTSLSYSIHDDGRYSDSSSLLSFSIQGEAYQSIGGVISDFDKALFEMDTHNFSNNPFYLSVKTSNHLTFSSRLHFQVIEPLSLYLGFNFLQYTQKVVRDQNVDSFFQQSKGLTKHSEYGNSNIQAGINLTF